MNINRIKTFMAEAKKFSVRVRHSIGGDKYEQTE